MPQNWHDSPVRSRAVCQFIGSFLLPFDVDTAGNRTRWLDLSTSINLSFVGAHTYQNAISRRAAPIPSPLLSQLAPIVVNHDHTRPPNPPSRARPTPAGGEPECFLAANPRDAALALETLVATYMATLDGFGSDSEPDTTSAGGNGNSTTVSGAGAIAPDVNGSPQLFNRRGQEQAAQGAPPSGPLPILQPARTTTQEDQRSTRDDEDDILGNGPRAGDVEGAAVVANGAGDPEEEEIPAMNEHHATEVFRVRGGDGKAECPAGRRRRGASLGCILRPCDSGTGHPSLV